MAKKNNVIDKTAWRTTGKERKSYYIGEVGRMCEAGIFTTFMSMFLIFQGIDLAAVAGVMLAVKIIDAFDDVVFGFLVDKIKITEWKTFRKITGDGKYLPWYRLTFFLFPIFTVGFFLMPSALSTAGKLIWFAVFYLLYDLSYTLIEVPMNSMAVTLTDNIDERNHIIQNKTIIGSVSLMVMMMVGAVLVSEYVGISIRTIALSCSLIFFFMMIPLSKGVKEHNITLENVDKEEAEHYSFKDMLYCVKTNKYLMVLLLSNIVISCLATGAAVGNLAAYYHFGSSLILAIPILISFVPSLIAQSQTAKLTKKFGKVRVVLVGGITGGIILTMIYFAGASFGVVATLLVLQALPGNVSNIAKGFLMPDTIEYTRYKTGKDCTGICYALNSFVTKLTASVSSSLGLFILGFSGWINVEATDFADLAAQGIVQPQSALDSLWIVYALIPAIGTLLGVMVLFLYRLKDKDVELMAKCNAGEISREECEARLSKKY